MWIPPQEALPELDLQIGAIVTSKLVLDGKQRRQQVFEAVARVADERMTVEWRMRCRLSNIGVLPAT